MNKDYSVKCFHTGPLGVNTYIIAYNSKAAIIDPGGNTKWLLLEIKQMGCELTHIFLTHGHFDHIGAVEELKEATGAKCYAHKNDARMLEDPALNLSSFFYGQKISCKADIELNGGDIIHFGKGINVIHTPGHSSGGCCYDTGEFLFTGDTILEYDIGRSDYPGGNHSELISSIKYSLYKLEGDRKIYPGHGESTMLSDEKKFNHYVTAE